jgi:hypothetical protein
VANQVSDDVSDFVPLGYPKTSLRLGPYRRVRLADVVEVRLSDDFQIMVRPPNTHTAQPLFREFKKNYGYISISHLCACRATNVDAEFAAFYDVLWPKTYPPDRLVPVEAPFGEDCYKSAKIAY